MLVDIAAMLAEFHGAADQPFGCGTLEDPFLNELRRDLIEEEAREARDALEAGDAAGALKELADLVYVVYGAAHLLGWPLDAALVEVHRSNMTKIGDGAEWRADGKLLKGPAYEPPNLAALLAAIYEQRGD